MNECPLKKYCSDDCANCTDQDKTEKIERIAEALQPIIANISQTIIPIIQETIHFIKRFWRAVIECYPNRRVVHLALYHPKSRVRKKNINRIMKWIERQEWKEE
jgi:pyruvate-formate lyase-activating enzyme